MFRFPRSSSLLVAFSFTAVITPGNTSHTHHGNCHHGDLSGDHSGHASDGYRQSTSDKLGDALKPDALKSGTEIQKDHLKGKADNAAGSAVPHENKSVGQKIA